MKVRRLIVLLSLMLSVILAPRGVLASQIQYNVLDLISGPAFMSGTITTNGTLGILSAGDILGWNLTLSQDGVSTAPVTSGVNGSQLFANGTALSATATELRFNFAAGFPNDVSFVDPFPNNDGQLCYTAFGNCWGVAGAGVYNVNGSGTLSFTAYSGLETIANGGTPVPEPASIVLMGTGLVGAGVRRYRARRA